MGLGSIRVGAGQQHQHIGPAGEGAPGLDPVDHIARFIARPGRRRGGDLDAGDVRPIVGLGHRHRYHRLGSSQTGQPVLLLGLGAALDQGAGENFGPGDQGTTDAERDARQLLGGHDHRRVLPQPTLVESAVFGRHRKAERAQLGQSGDHRFRHIVVGAVHVFGMRLDLALGEGPKGVGDHLEVGVEMPGPGRLRQRGHGDRIAPGRDEVVRRRQIGGVDVPQLLPTDQLGHQIVKGISDERAGQGGFGRAFGAVVEHRSGGGHRRGDMGYVVGQDLIGVRSAAGHQMRQRLVNSAFGEFDR